MGSGKTDGALLYTNCLGSEHEGTENSSQNTRLPTTVAKASGKDRARKNKRIKGTAI